MSRALAACRTRRVLRRGLLAALAGIFCGGVPAAEPAPAAQAGPGRALLDRYCVGCHNERQPGGGLALDALDPADAAARAEDWERVVRQLRSGVMPPPGARRPAGAQVEAFAARIETALDQAAAAAPDPGSPPIQRLNRTEYANAVRDLLEIEIDAESLLPADPSLDGFDNFGGVLSVSPALLERYLAAARRISRLAVGDTAIDPAFASRTYDIDKQRFQNQRMDEDLPFGSRGGAAVRHHFPLDGEYVVRARLRRNIFGYVRGLADPHRLEIRLDGAPAARFTVGGRDLGQPAPASFGGVIAGDPEWEAYALAADADLETRLHVPAGLHVVGVAFFDRPVEEEGILQPPLTGLGLGFSEWRSAPAGPPGPAIDSIAISGPYDPSGPGETPSRQRIFTCRPASDAGDVQCASEILAALARRAYRRPVAAAEVDVLLEFFREGRRSGAFETGVRTAIERLLVDPRFLFRVEPTPAGVAAGEVYRLGGLELASRLAFFLWSGPPDDELLELAARGRLPDAAVLASQVRRMLADDRSAALVRNFARQWLNVPRLDDIRPDPEQFPEFDDNLREGFRRETELFIEHQLRADRSILDLLAADYTFLNERLARHYGVAGVYGSRLRPVAFTGGRRGGLLGHGSILSVTSQPTRTSPVQRGLWLLENVFGSPPPPPPPDTPTALPGRSRDGAPQSVRQRMERHRRNPACAGCHARMDPLGFALENYDAIGRWRDRDDTGAPIDASGRFPDGTRFDGPAGLRRVARQMSGAFVRTVTEKLLMYALGRPLTHADMPAVRAIVRRAAAADYRWSALILEIAGSVPFRMRRAPA